MVLGVLGFDACVGCVGVGDMAYKEVSWLPLALPRYQHRGHVRSELHLHLYLSCSMCCFSVQQQPPGEVLAGMRLFLIVSCCWMMC